MRRTGLLSLVLLLAAACTSREDPARPAPVATKQTASVEVPATPPAPTAITPATPATPVITPAVTPPATPEPVVVAEPAPVVAEPVPVVEPVPVAVDPAAPVDPEVPVVVATVPIQETTPTPTTVTWREVLRQSEAIAFLPLTRGVLGKSASGYHDLDAGGALVLRPEIEAPNGEVLGAWPDNAWVIELRVKTIVGDRSDIELRDLRLMRLRGKRRWVPQEYNGVQRFEDAGQQFQIGGTGGLIVQSDGSLTRIADNAVDPVLGLDGEGDLRGFFETKSGRVYTVRQTAAGMYVQRDCADPGCVARERTRLPLADFWSFSQPVTRQQHSISAVAEVRVDDKFDESFLLHYETGGWKLESIDVPPDALWPTKDGGLWTMDGTKKLLYRDPAGVWRDIALPAGATGVTGAMRPDFSELWITAKIGEETVVFATAANAQMPVAAPAAAAP